MAVGLGLSEVGEKCGGVFAVLLSSSCTCAGSGECTGRSRACQGSSWAVGEMGGKRGCREGRWFPKVAE